jgi:hypothetical protein
MSGKRIAPEKLRTEDPNWLLIEECFALAREHLRLDCRISFPGFRIAKLNVKSDKGEF